MEEGSEGIGGSRVALCLAGGGYSGALFEFGAVAALNAGLEGWDVGRSSVVVGTSCGAVAGAMLAMGISSEDIRIALEADGNHALSFTRSDFSRVPWSRHGHGWWRVLTSLPGLITKHRSGLKLAAGDVAEDLRPLLPLGVFTNSGLEEFLEKGRTLSGCTDRFEDLTVPLVVTATDLDLGERAVYGTGWDSSPPVSLAVRASTAIPVYFEPIRIGGRDLVDGQIVDPMHLDLAASSGAASILAINPLVPFRRGDTAARVRDTGAAAIMDQTGRISASIKQRGSLEQISREYPEVRCVFIEPEPEEVPQLLQTGFQTQSMQLAWELGFRAAARVLANPETDWSTELGPGMKADLQGLTRMATKWRVSL